MTPELAAENAAKILDQANEHPFDAHEAAALVNIADGWTRLHTSLAHAPKPIAPADWGRTIASPCLDWRDRKTHDAHDWAAADGGLMHCVGWIPPDDTEPNAAPIPVLKTDGETVFEFHGERWRTIASSFRRNDLGGASELSLRIVPDELIALGWTPPAGDR